VRRWSQSNDQETGIWITETRQRLRPIRLSRVAMRRFFGDCLAPTYKPGTLSAIHDRAVKFVKTLHGTMAYGTLPLAWPASN
jgi:hypothetical protein